MSNSCALCGREISDPADATPFDVRWIDSPFDHDPVETLAAHHECALVWGAGFGGWCESIVPDEWDGELSEYARCGVLDGEEQKALAIYWGLHEQPETTYVS